MDKRIRKNEVFKHFSHVFDWAFAVASKELVEKGAMPPTLLLTGLQNGQLTIAGMVNLSDDPPDVHEQVLRTLVTTRSVNTGVLIRETRPTKATLYSDVRFILMSKQFVLDHTLVFDSKARRLTHEAVAQHMLMDIREH